jgi:hypothetical protein
VNELRDLITDEMKRFFVLRTRQHLYLVNKYSNKIRALNHAQIDNDLLDGERDEHDAFKWIDPEYTPYVLITWRYEQKRLGKEFELPEEIKASLHEATYHHVKSHKHHPEYWDTTTTDACLNSVNRDLPSDKMVDASEMPLTYVAAMVADWLGMSEELGTCPWDWCKKNIGKRWYFTEQQSHFIHRLLEAVWPPDPAKLPSLKKDE